MSIEAPYKGREDAPQGQASANPADKPESDVEVNDEVETLEADKPGDVAPQDEVETEELTGEEEAEVPGEDDDSKEVPDVAEIVNRKELTKWSMKLADRERAIEQRERETQTRLGVYEQVDGLIAQNPELARTHTVEQLVTMLQAGTAPTANANISPEARAEIAAMRREIAETRKENQETKESLFVDRVQSTVKRYAKQYGLKRPQVEQMVKFAIDDEQIAPGMAVERINRRLGLIASSIAAKGAEARGQQKLVKQLVEKGKAASPGASSPASTETSQPRVKGWDNLVKQFTATKARAG